jgi:hypothetical protein
VANPQIQLRPKTHNSDFKQPSPNFGFAWNPDFENGFLGKIAGGSNLVIRGGFAVNHYDEGWIPWENVSTGSLSNQSVCLNPGFGPGLLVPGSISFDPTGASFPTPPNTLPASFQLPMAEAALTFTRDGVLSTVDPKIRSPYIQNCTFGFERKLTGNWALDVNYVGNHSVHMWAAYDLNEVNIFENGFLQGFKNAQLNLAASNATTFAGANPTPILSQAYAGPACGDDLPEPQQHLPRSDRESGSAGGGNHTESHSLLQPGGQHVFALRDSGICRRRSGSDANRVPDQHVPAQSVFRRSGPYAPVGSRERVVQRAADSGEASRGP